MPELERRAIHIADPAAFNQSQDALDLLHETCHLLESYNNFPQELSLHVPYPHARWTREDSNRFEMPAGETPLFTATRQHDTSYNVHAYLPFTDSLRGVGATAARYTIQGGRGSLYEGDIRISSLERSFSRGTSEKDYALISKALLEPGAVVRDLLGSIHKLRCGYLMDGYHNISWVSIPVTT